MKNRLMIIWLSLLLMGCPGGWRAKMISTNSLEPVAHDAMLTHHSFGYSKLIAPGYLIDDVLYLKMFSENPHDLAFDMPVDAEYQISGLIAATHDKVSIDKDSFFLSKAGKVLVTQPTIVATNARVVVNEYGQAPRSVCGFRGNAFEYANPRISVPVFDQSRGKWPPENIDDSVLCISIEFGISIRNVPPQEQFQLHFKYYVDDIPNEATLYFYPFKYTVFEH